MRIIGSRKLKDDDPDEPMNPAGVTAVPEGRFAPVAQPEGRPRRHPVVLRR
jgi:hypothetical protein